jgi:hypothetical protein
MATAQLAKRSCPIIVSASIFAFNEILPMKLCHVQKLDGP